MAGGWNYLLNYLPQRIRSAFGSQRHKHILWVARRNYWSFPTVGAPGRSLEIGANHNMEFPAARARENQSQ